MRKLLSSLLLLSCLITNAYAQTDKLAVFIQSGNGVIPNADRLGCLYNGLERGGWTVDVYDASNRTWGGGADTTDRDWFGSRYKAVLIVSGNFGAGVAIGSGYGTNFLNSTGVARVSHGPLGGRWTIPVVCLAQNIVPSTTFDDTTANNYVAGIDHTSPSGTFAKPNEASAGTWRYRLLSHLKGVKDTFYCDPGFFTCKPAANGAAGNVNPILYADTTNGLNNCTGSDTIMSAWTWQPRPDRPGITYILLDESISTNKCMGALLALQIITQKTTLRPKHKIKALLVEHAPRPATLSSTDKATFKALHEKLDNNSVKYQIAVSTLPSGFPSSYDREVINILKESLKKSAIWTTFTDMGYYNSTDTANARQLWNAHLNCATHPDTFGLPIAKYWNKDQVTANGIVGVWMGKVLVDAGVKVITSTADVPQASWTFQTSTFSRGAMTQYVIPGANDGRIIQVRPTWGLNENATFTGLIGTSAAHEYIGSTFIKAIGASFAKPYSIFWHSNVVCAGDPYYQWLLGDVLVKHYSYFNNVIELNFPVIANR